MKKIKNIIKKIKEDFIPCFIFYLLLFLVFEKLVLVFIYNKFGEPKAEIFIYLAHFGFAILIFIGRKKIKGKSLLKIFRWPINKIWHLTDQIFNNYLRFGSVVAKYILLIWLINFFNLFTAPVNIFIDYWMGIEKIIPIANNWQEKQIQKAKNYFPPIKTPDWIESIENKKDDFYKVARFDIVFKKCEKKCSVPVSVVAGFIQKESSGNFVCFSVPELQGDEFGPPQMQACFIPKTMGRADHFIKHTKEKKDKRPMEFKRLQKMSVVIGLTNFLDKKSVLKNIKYYILCSTDDRLDVKKSFIFASGKLKKYYEQFNDWGLVYAAWNASPTKAQAFRNTERVETFLEYTEEYKTKKFELLNKNLTLAEN